jgi:transcriptional regulator with XRE-family HTH domain
MLGDLMLGEAIRIARVFQGMSQQDLAKAMGVSSGYLSQIESGAREPSQETLRSAALALQVPTSALVFFSEQIQAAEGEGDAEARQRFGRKILDVLAKIERSAE